MQKSAAMPQRLEKETMVSLLDFNATSSFGLSATTAMVCPLSSGMRAGRPANTDGETASSEPVSQLGMDDSHAFSLELPAAQTRIVLSATPACAIAAMASAKFARRSASP